MKKFESKNLRYVAYAFSVLYCAVLITLAFWGNLPKSKSITFEKLNCTEYVSFIKSGNGTGTTDSVSLSSLKIINKTHRTIKNMKLYAQADAEASIYEIPELKPRSSYSLSITVATKDMHFSFYHIKFWAEGELI